MPGEALAISNVAELLSKVFGWTVDPTGLSQLKLENKLKYIKRGIDEAIQKNDWASADALFQSYRDLVQEQGP